MAAGEGKLNRRETRATRLCLQGTAVLLYHGLCDSTMTEKPARERKYWVRTRQFRRHLDRIRAEGFRVLPLSEWWSGALIDGSDPVILTFDDGQVSDYEVAFPILNEFRAPADFFVSTANVGKPGYLTWSQIKGMKRAGMGFHSHGHDHVDLSRLSDAGLKRQLSVSKALIEDNLGTPVEFAAIPYGLVSDRVFGTAQELGYKAICTSRNWPACSGAEIIDRVSVYGHTSPGELGALVNRQAFPYIARSVRAALIYVPKRVMLRFRARQYGIQVQETGA